MDLVKMRLQFMTIMKLCINKTLNSEQTLAQQWRGQGLDPHRKTT